MKFKFDIISKILIYSSLALIVSQIALYLATLIDGVITSRYLGEEPYIALSLIGPSLSLLGMLSAVISGGSQILYGRFVGMGEKDKANKVFSLSMIMAIAVCIVFVILFLVFEEDIFSLCGITVLKYPTIYSLMEQYLYGYLFGAPALVVIAVLSPIVIIDNNKKLIPISSLVMCVTNICGDLISVFFFNGGLFGIAVASSMSETIQCLIILLHFISKNCNTKFTFKFWDKKSFLKVIKGGSPEAVRKLANTFRDIAVNRVNLYVALSYSSIAARGVQSDINKIMFSFSNGFSRAIMSLSSIYYGAKDYLRVKHLFVLSIKFALLFSSVICFLLFLFSNEIVLLYSDHEGFMYFATFGIKCMAIALVFDMLAAIIQGYMQGTGHIHILNIYLFFERFFIPVLLSIVMGLCFGPLGVLSSIAIGKVLQLIILLILIAIRNKKFPTSIKEILLFDEDIDEVDSSSLELTVKSLENLDDIYNKINVFCSNLSIADNRCNTIKLIVEEICTNTFKYGNKKHHRKPMIDVRIFSSKDDISITFHDDGRPFNPVEFYKKHLTDKKYEKLGLKLVFDNVKDAKYINTFNVNISMFLI